MSDDDWSFYHILLEFDWLLHDVFAFEIIEIYWLDFLVLRIFIGESGKTRSVTLNWYVPIHFTNVSKRVKHKCKSYLFIFLNFVLLILYTLRGFFGFTADHFSIQRGCPDGDQSLRG